MLGRADAVVTIHGGTQRGDRRVIREAFTHDPDVRVLVATDAAGEGLNLQAAHLMINYDLPWNPNRIEQRFGRIHRIGQKQVCRLWNLVADETREGPGVCTTAGQDGSPTRRLRRPAVRRPRRSVQRPALSKLLMEAVRYGDDPARQAELERVLDAEVSKGTEDLLRERALARESLTPTNSACCAARWTKPAPGACSPTTSNCSSATPSNDSAAGSAAANRAATRSPTCRPPSAPGNAPGAALPIATRYERATFEPDCVDADDARRAELLAPGTR